MGPRMRFQTLSVAAFAAGRGKVSSSNLCRSDSPTSANTSVQVWRRPLFGRAYQRLQVLGGFLAEFADGLLQGRMAKLFEAHLVASIALIGQERDGPRNLFSWCCASVRTVSMTELACASKSWLTLFSVVCASSVKTARSREASCSPSASHVARICSRWASIKAEICPRPAPLWRRTREARPRLCL